MSILIKELKKADLGERNSIIENLKRQFAVVARSLLEVNGYTMLDNECNDKYLVFEINGKKYQVSAHFFRIRKSHVEYGIDRGSVCGDGHGDGGYETNIVYDEDE